MPNDAAITPIDLLALIGTPECPLIIDVTIDEDFAEDPHLIPTANRHSHQDPDGLVAQIRGQPCVVVCQKGLKLSQGMTAWLHSAGERACYLEGGNQGWRTLPGALRIPSHSLPCRSNGASLWVAQHRPTLTELASAWLVRRFIDRSARILFVAPQAMPGVADRFGALPLINPQVRKPPAKRQGPFADMLGDYHLTTPPLLHIAKLVKGAHTGKSSKTPQSAGIAAIFGGLSCQFRNDTKLMEAGFGVFDALYRWTLDSHTNRPPTRQEYDQ